MHTTPQKKGCNRCPVMGYDLKKCQLCDVWFCVSVLHTKIVNFTYRLYRVINVKNIANIGTACFPRSGQGSQAIMKN
jgi:hypothetical protein